METAVTEEELKRETDKLIMKQSASNLSFMKKETDHLNDTGITFPSTRQSILNQATQIATNDRQALYGDQTELNQCVGMLHRWMIKYRPERMKDGEFTQWLSNANEMGRIFKSPVNNSEPFSNLAAGIGIAAECASKEDKQ